MTSKKVSVDLRLPEFSANKILLWKCHVDSKNTSSYDMIIGRDLLITLLLDLKFSENIIIGGDEPYEECSAPMVLLLLLLNRPQFPDGMHIVRRCCSTPCTEAKETPYSVP